MKLALYTMAACALAAQAPDAKFDAASIKPARPGQRGYSIRPLPGRVSAQNVTLQELIGEAYHVFDFQVAGGPKWIDSDRYDVEAKAAGGAAPSQKELRNMLQGLLAGRFGLQVRRESKEMPIFVLEPDKGGPKVEAAKHPDQPPMFRVFQRRQITAENAPLEYLTETLTWVTGRPVIDRTGLAGSFDYKLEWAPDELQLQSSEAPVETDGKAPPLDGALQHAMGLRLVAQRGPVDIIVVEKAERPAAN